MTDRSFWATAFVFAFGVFLFMPNVSRGQNASGKIQLEVKDPSGSPMQASGRIIRISGATSGGLGKGVTKPFQTDAQGRYAFEDLSAATYQIEITRAGFATQTLSIVVRSGATVSQTVTMTLMPQATHVDVVGATPLAGTDIPLDEIPAPVQTATALDIEQSGSLDLSDLLNRRLSGVYINENQDNPFQPDVNYRGYTASPLLGTPEGLSVYMDGVRQNQPFGDIVAWDLIPKISISEVTLIPGSNPLFGLNTLGGALSIDTKDGLSQPGGSLQLSGGSFGREAAEAEYGGSIDSGFNYYVAGNVFHEDGWRIASPSNVRQGFTKLGFQRDKTAIFLSGGYADNKLTGNGLQDFRFLRTNYRSVYTIPDITWDRAPFVNLSGRYSFNSNVTISGNAYFRFIRTQTFNGDINDDSFDQSLYNLSTAEINALHAAGYSGFPTTGNSTTEPFPFWRCIAQGLLKDEPAEKCTGLINRTLTKQYNYGLSGQLAWLVARNRIIAGAAWDRNNLAFVQGTQFGYLNTDGISLTPINSFEDGTTQQDGTPVDDRVNLHGLINTGSIYATDTISVGKSLAFTISGRYNRTSLDNSDRLPVDPSGARGSLNGQYVFDRFNPAVGVTYTPVSFATVYFGYSEASRAPTAIELGCADPNEPCNLPNDFVGDPPLKQVVTRTFEAGIRSAGEGKLRWNIGWFHGENYNDLLFVASQQTGFGYFTNFGRTRRDGMEVNLSGRFHKLVAGGGYTFLNATYQSPQTLNGGSNSSNDGGAGLDGDIQILQGDRIPQIPQHMLKAYADYQITSRIAADIDYLAVSSSYVRGNENNLDQPDGVHYLGAGTTPGYGVVNLGAHFQAQRRIQFFVQIDNLLNHHYYTAGQLGTTPYDNARHFIPRPFAAVPGGDFPLRTTTFYGPGAPIGAWGGVRFRF